MKETQQRHQKTPKNVNGGKPKKKKRKKNEKIKKKIRKKAPQHLSLSGTRAAHRSGNLTRWILTCGPLGPADLIAARCYTFISRKTRSIHWATPPGSSTGSPSPGCPTGSPHRVAPPGCPTGLPSPGGSHHRPHHRTTSSFRAYTSGRPSFFSFLFSSFCYCCCYFSRFFRFCCFCFDCHPSTLPYFSISFPLLLFSRSYANATPKTISIMIVIIINIIEESDSIIAN